MFIQQITPELRKNMVLKIQLTRLPQTKECPLVGVEDELQKVKFPIELYQEEKTFKKDDTVVTNTGNCRSSEISSCFSTKVFYTIVISYSYL